MAVPARNTSTYDDLRYLPINLSDAELEEVSDSLAADREVSRVRLALPPGGDSPYARVVAFIDQESCVALRTEFYEPADKPLKILSVDPAKIQRTAGIRLSHSMTLEDLKNEVVTELRVMQVQVDPELPDEIFIPACLDRNQCREPGTLLDIQSPEGD